MTIEFKPKKGKETVFAYLDSLSREQIALMTETVLHESFSKLLQTTIRVYLSQYRKDKNIIPVYVRKGKKLGMRANSIRFKVYKFLDKNPDKRYVMEVLKEYPDISSELIKQYTHSWGVERDVQLPIDALKLFNSEKWTEEKLIDLKEKSYGNYIKIMTNMGKIPKQINRLKKVKEEIINEGVKFIDSAFSRKKFACEPELDILTRICLKYPTINLERTSEQVKSIEKDLHRLVRTHAPSVVVGTSIFLSNNISKAKVRRIMMEYGRCSEPSIRSLIKRLEND